jgi:predicted nucleotidyltransferase
MHIQYDALAVEEICLRYKITELSFFGSVIRDDFTGQSDIDILVQFNPGEAPSISGFEDLRMELQHLLGRKVDLVTKRSIEKSKNQFRRKEILGHFNVIYAA